MEIEEPFLTFVVVLKYLTKAWYFSTARTTNVKRGLLNFYCIFLYMFLCWYSRKWSKCFPKHVAYMRKQFKLIKWTYVAFKWINMVYLFRFKEQDNTPYPSGTWWWWWWWWLISVNVEMRISISNTWIPVVSSL